MIKFVFLLTIWTAESHIPEVHVMDHNLTGEDCIRLMVEYHETYPLHIDGSPSCEVDFGENV